VDLPSTRNVRADRLARLAQGVLVSLLAATAVDLGFRGGFVVAHIAWATTAYATALIVVLIGRDSARDHFSERVWVRVPLAFTTGGLTLLLLRGPLLGRLPHSELATTGHSPYVVLPSATVVTFSMLALLRCVGNRPRQRGIRTKRSADG
jgi:hypothetical protein